MAPKKTVLIVDDHPLFRDGLKALIERKPGFSVVGEAGTARDGLRLATELKPELAVVDISLPDKSGIELTRSIRSKLPQTRVLIVSMHSKIQYITEALQAGGERLCSQGISRRPADTGFGSGISRRVLFGQLPFP